MGSVNLWSCRNAGSLSAPLRGSTAAAAWPRIGSASTERPWRSCVSPQSASCSENSAIRPEVSGQTLRTQDSAGTRGGVTPRDRSSPDAEGIDLDQPDAPAPALAGIAKGHDDWPGMVRSREGITLLLPRRRLIAVQR